MIKNFTKNMLRALGLQVIRIPKKPFSLKSRQKKINKSTKRINYLDALVKDPLNPELHLDYAIEASVSRRPYLAFAELKTAEYLGANRKQIEEYLGAFRQALPNPKDMNHNQFFRFASLSSEIAERGEAIYQY